VNFSHESVKEVLQAQWAAENRCGDLVRVWRFEGTESFVGIPGQYGSIDTLIDLLIHRSNAPDLQAASCGLLRSPADAEDIVCACIGRARIDGVQACRVLSPSILGEVPIAHAVVTNAVFPSCDEPGIAKRIQVLNWMIPQMSGRQIAPFIALFLWLFVVCATLVINDVTLSAEERNAANKIAAENRDTADQYSTGYAFFMLVAGGFCFASAFSFTRKVVLNPLLGPRTGVFMNRRWFLGPLKALAFPILSGYISAVWLLRCGAGLWLGRCCRRR